MNAMREPFSRAFLIISSIIMLLPAPVGAASTWRLCFSRNPTRKSSMDCNWYSRSSRSSMVGRRLQRLEFALLCHALPLHLGQLVHEGVMGYEYTKRNKIVPRYQLRHRDYAGDSREVFAQLWMEWRCRGADDSRVRLHFHHALDAGPHAGVNLVNEYDVERRPRLHLFQCLSRRDLYFLVGPESPVL